MVENWLEIVEKQQLGQPGRGSWVGAVTIGVDPRISCPWSIFR